MIDDVIFMQDRLTRCPCNPHHYVLDDRVEGHSRKCGQEVQCMHTGAQASFHTLFCVLQVEGFRGCH